MSQLSKLVNCKVPSPDWRFSKSQIVTKLSETGVMVRILENPKVCQSPVFHPQQYNMPKRASPIVCEGAIKKSRSASPGADLSVERVDTPRPSRSASPGDSAPRRRNASNSSCPVDSSEQSPRRLAHSSSSAPEEGEIVEPEIVEPRDLADTQEIEEDEIVEPEIVEPADLADTQEIEEGEII
jgi:hypothetical protein